MKAASPRALCRALVHPCGAMTHDASRNLRLGESTVTYLSIGKVHTSFCGESYCLYTEKMMCSVSRPLV